MAIVVERKKLNFFERWYLPQIVSGLCITFKNFLKPKVTIEYPDQRPALPAGYRGAPTLVKDSEGREKCVSCQLCEFVCPSKAIRVTPGSIDSGSEYAYIEKAPKEFKINMLRCIYCGLCEEACPEKAIVLQDTYALNSTSREDLIFDKARLYAAGGTLPDKIMKWKRVRDNAELKGEH